MPIKLTKAEKEAAATAAPFILYQITNTITGRAYIGVTSGTLRLRWTRHIIEARTSADRPLMRAIRKYGKAAFEVTHIASARTEVDAFAMEILLIQQEGTMVPNGYNAVAGGQGNLSPSLETRAKMSAKSKARMESEERRATLSKIATEQWADPALRAAQAERARKQFSSPEGRKEMSSWATERWADHEARAAHSALLLKVRSDLAVRAAMGVVNKATWTKRKARQTPEEYDAMRAAMSARAKAKRASETPEQRASRARKMAASATARHAAMTPEQKAQLGRNISAGQRGKNGVPETVVLPVASRPILPMPQSRRRSAPKEPSLQGVLPLTPRERDT